MSRGHPARRPDPAGVGPTSDCHGRIQPRWFSESGTEGTAGTDQRCYGGEGSCKHASQGFRTSPDVAPSTWHCGRIRELPGITWGQLRPASSQIAPEAWVSATCWKVKRCSPDLQFCRRRDARPGTILASPRGDSARTRPCLRGSAATPDPHPHGCSLVRLTGLNDEIGKDLAGAPADGNFGGACGVEGHSCCGGEVPARWASTSVDRPDGRPVNSLWSHDRHQDLGHRESRPARERSTLRPACRVALGPAHPPPFLRRSTNGVSADGSGGTGRSKHGPASPDVIMAPTAAHGCHLTEPEHFADIGIADSAHHRFHLATGQPAALRHRSQPGVPLELRVDRPASADLAPSHRDHAINIVKDDAPVGSGLRSGPRSSPSTSTPSRYSPTPLATVREIKRQAASRDQIHPSCLRIAAGQV